MYLQEYSEPANLRVLSVPERLKIDDQHFERNRKNSLGEQGALPIFTQKAMSCPECHHQHESTVKFCSNCGAKLAVVCPKCLHQNAPGAKFCSECGAGLIKEPPKPERRQVTAMFCDLVGSTQLSEALEVEEYSTLVGDYQSICKRIITRFGTEVHHFLGDGVVAFFGFPTAHEDDARRSVACALEIIQAMDLANTERIIIGKIPLSMRIGIHTGMVVGGTISGNNQVLGKTPNLAARLEGVAEVGKVAISPATYRLVKGYFDVVSLGVHHLKGLSEPMEVFQVTGASGKSHRLDQVADIELSPFVGRVVELDLIHRQWQQLETGNGSVVLIKGDAGIGKSRLVHQLKLSLASARPLNVLTVQTSALTQNSAFHPLSALLKHHFSETELMNLVANRDGAILSVLQKVAGLQLPEDFIKPELSAAKLKQLTLEVFTMAIMSRAAHQPLLLIFEDLHWADPSTLDWLGLLVEQRTHHRILAVITTRPMSTFPERITDHALVQIDLDRLSDKEVYSICRFKSKGKALPKAILSEIVTKTDGIPLFVEELTSDLLESGVLKEEAHEYVLADDHHRLNIPSTLQGSLTSRMDRMGRSKELVQIGSVLGREFSYEVLWAVSNFSEEELAASLQKLTDNEILFRTNRGGRTLLIFKHTLVQDAAYESMLKDERKKLHDHIAETIEQAYPSIARAQPELIAHHLTNGKRPEAAIPKWMLAGQHAMHQNANLEAVHHLERALELSEALPASSEKAEREIQILITLGGLYGTVGTGASGPQNEEYFTKAYELSRQSGDAVNLLYIRCGLLQNAILSGVETTSLEILQSIFEIAEKTGDPLHLYAAKYARALFNAYSGRFASAKEELEEIIPIYDPEAHGYLSLVAYGDVHNTNLTSYEMVLAIMGYLEQARQVQNQYFDWVRKNNKMMPYWVATVMSSFACLFSRNFIRLAEIVEEAYPRALEKKEEFPVAMLKFFYGFVQTINGGNAESLDLAYEGLKGQEAMRNRFASNIFRINLAEFLLDQNQTEAAATFIEDAEKSLHEINGQHQIKEELLRVKGKYYQKINAQFEAELWYQKAIALSREKQSKLFELRASNGLARLWMDQGRVEEARRLLYGIYGWFREGFEISADLKETEKLLREKNIFH